MGLHDCPEIGIRELRQHASRYVAMAQNGNTVIVTNHGAPVARLTPIDEPAGDSIGQMIADGELLPPDDQGSFLDLPIAHASPDAPSGQAILDEIREDRL